MYNPSYPGGRDQEGQSSKPVWASNSQDLISKKKNKNNPSQKRGSGGLSSSLQKISKIKKKF
jgi:hypothetical protein